MKQLFVLTLVLTIFACQPKSRSIKLNKFEDIELQKIYTYQYNRQSDSLISYLKSDNPIYRAEAALSFSSIQDSNYLTYLYPLLSDPDTTVRINAAFAIGQTGAVSSEPELIKSISFETDPKVTSTKLEALGRVATSEGLSFITGFSTENNVVKGGKAWGIYRAGLRNITSEAAQNVMLDYASATVPFEARLAAGHYFYRLKKYPDGLRENAMLLSSSDDSPEIRMIYTTVLSGYHENDVENKLLIILTSDSVYNVRVSAVNALKSFQKPKVYNAVWNAVQNDKHISVRLAAAEYIAASDIKPDNNLINYVQSENDEIIRAVLLGAFMQNDIAETVTAIANDYLKTSDDRFEKQLLIKSLLMHKANFKQVFNYMKLVEDRDFILSVAYTLNDMLDQGKIMPGEFKSLLSEWLTTDNPYLVRQAAWFTTKPGLTHNPLLTGQLKDALSKLKTYKDKTVPNAIEKALEKSQNNEEPDENWDAEYYEQPETFEVFNWDTIVTIPADLNIDVYTEKGKFTMQLMVEDAPFSVRHFVDLIKEDFFEGAPFYRVIPNYVKQAGGAKEPNFDELANERIRSEFNRHKFRSNVVVVASAGRDTESSHFAIMISPAPWNDNHYTVFGRITGNKEVVQHLMPGDLIYSMEILCKYKI